MDVDTKWAEVKFMFAKNTYFCTEQGSLLQTFRCIEVHRESLRCLPQNTYHVHHMFGRQHAIVKIQTIEFDWLVSSKGVQHHMIFNKYYIHIDTWKCLHSEKLLNNQNITWFRSRIKKHVWISKVVKLVFVSIWPWAHQLWNWRRSPCWLRALQWHTFLEDTQCWKTSKTSTRLL